MFSIFLDSSGLIKDENFLFYLDDASFELANLSSAEVILIIS